MKKYISIISMFVACFVGVANAVPMNAQIADLIQQKAEKIAKLEECEGKKKGWMIAGISTVGLTAVGVAGNIALAAENKRLDTELAAANTKNAYVHRAPVWISEEDDCVVESLPEKQPDKNGRLFQGKFGDGIFYAYCGEHGAKAGCPDGTVFPGEDKKLYMCDGKNGQWKNVQLNDVARCGHEDLKWYEDHRCEPYEHIPRFVGCYADGVSYAWLTCVADIDINLTDED